MFVVESAGVPKVAGMAALAFHLRFDAVRKGREGFSRTGEERDLGTCAGREFEGETLAVFAGKTGVDNAARKYDRSIVGLGESGSRPLRMSGRQGKTGSEGADDGERKAKRTEKYAGKEAGATGECGGKKFRRAVMGYRNSCRDTAEWNDKGLTEPHLQRVE
jgi:hypothetical protein